MIPRTETFDLSRFLLLGGVSLIIAYTLAPMEFELAHFGSRWTDAVSLNYAEGWIKMIAHFFTFVLLGCLLGRAFPGLRMSVPVIAGFCLLLEGAQLFVPERHARVGDMILNITAASLGQLIARRTGASNTGQAYRASRVFKGTLACIAGVWLSASVFPLALLSLGYWARECKVAIGNELDNSEPWMGVISHLAIFSNAREKSGTAPADPLLAYDLTQPDGHFIRSRGCLQSEQLNLSLSSHNMATGDGLLLTTLSEATLSKKIVESGAFRILAQVHAVDLSPDAVGRLISLSSSVSKRNFMLGREGNDLVFRVRNGIMEENGPRNALIARNALNSSLQFLIATYDHGFASLYADGVMLRSIDLRQPTVFLRLGNGSGGALSGGALIGIFAALPVYLLLPSVDAFFRHILALFGSSAIALAPFVVVCLILGGPLNLSFICLFTAALIAAYLMANYFCMRKKGFAIQGGTAFANLRTRYFGN